MQFYQFCPFEFPYIKIHFSKYVINLRLNNGTSLGMAYHIYIFTTDSSNFMQEMSTS